MKLERQIAIVRSMLRTALEEKNELMVLRLFGLLFNLQAEYIFKLEKDGAPIKKRKVA